MIAFMVLFTNQIHCSLFLIQEHVLVEEDCPNTELVRSKKRECLLKGSECLFEPDLY